MEKEVDEPDPLVHTGIPSFLPDEVVALVLPCPPDDHKQFQDLLWRVAKELQIPLEKVPDSKHKFLDILMASGIQQNSTAPNEGILELARTVWHTPSTCANPKKAENWHFVQAKGEEFLFSHPGELPHCPSRH